MSKQILASKWTLKKNRVQMESFAQRLTEAIQKTGLSRPQFAAKAGVGTSALAKWLSGKLVPKSEQLLSIARTSGCRMEWLLAGEGPQFIDPAAAMEDAFKAGNPHFVDEAGDLTPDGLMAFDLFLTSTIEDLRAEITKRGGGSNEKAAPVKRSKKSKEAAIAAQISGLARSLHFGSTDHTQAFLSALDAAPPHEAIAMVEALMKEAERVTHALEGFKSALARMLDKQSQ